MNKKLTCLALCFLMCGCATDQAYRYYATEKYPPKQDTQVEVLQAEPARKHKVIAEFQARNMSVNEMRHEAAKIGADAVIVVFLGGPKARAEEWADKDSFAGTGDRSVGVAIRYTE